MLFSPKEPTVPLTGAPSLDVSRLQDWSYGQSLLESVTEDQAVEFASLAGRTELPMRDVGNFLGNVARLKFKRVAECFAEIACDEGMDIERRKASIQLALLSNDETGLRTAWHLLQAPGSVTGIKETAAREILDASSSTGEHRKLRRFLMDALQSDPESWHLTVLASMFTRNRVLARKADLNLIVRHHLERAENYPRERLISIAISRNVRGMLPLLSKSVAAEISTGKVRSDMARAFLRVLPFQPIGACRNIAETLRDGAGCNYIDRMQAALTLYDRRVDGSFEGLRRVFEELPLLTKRFPFDFDAAEAISAMCRVYQHESEPLPPGVCVRLIAAFPAEPFSAARYLERDLVTLVQSLAVAATNGHGRYPESLDRMILNDGTPECMRAALILALPAGGVKKAVLARLEKIAGSRHRSLEDGWAEKAAACIKLGELRGGFTDNQREFLIEAPAYYDGAHAVVQKWIDSKAPFKAPDAEKLIRGTPGNSRMLVAAIKERLLKDPDIESRKFMQSCAAEEKDVLERQTILGTLASAGHDPALRALRKERRILAPAAVEALYPVRESWAVRLLYRSMCGERPSSYKATRVVSHVLAEKSDSTEKVAELAGRLNAAADDLNGLQVAGRMRRYAEALLSAKEYGIINPFRANPNLLPKLILNREMISSIPVKTPVVLVLASRADHNGVGNGTSLDSVMRRYEKAGARVLYFEASSQSELVQIKNHYLEARGGVPARAVILFGHGDGKALNLGDMRGEIDCAPSGANAEAYIDSERLDFLLDNEFGRILGEGGGLLTLSCLAGNGGRRNKKSFLQGMRILFPQAKQGGIIGMSGAGWVDGVHLRRDLSIRRVLYRERGFIREVPLAATKL